MEANHSIVEGFWQSYLHSLPENQRGRIYFEAFQSEPGREMAHQLARLVLDGIKTATSDLLWHLEAQGKPLWRIGDEHVVLDSDWRPVCVIRTTESARRPFCEVDESFALDYREGDRTLTWWRKHMFDWYAAECRQIGREPRQDMPLLCEPFQVVYVAPESRDG